MTWNEWRAHSPNNMPFSDLMVVPNVECREMENVSEIHIPTGHDLHYNFISRRDHRRHSWRCFEFLCSLQSNDTLLFRHKFNSSHNRRTQALRTNERILEWGKKRAIFHFGVIFDCSEREFFFFFSSRISSLVCSAKQWATASDGYNDFKCYRKTKFQDEKRQTECPIAWQNRSVERE